MQLQGVQLSQLHQITQIQIGRCSCVNSSSYNSSLRNSTP